MESSQISRVNHGKPKGACDIVVGTFRKVLQYDLGWIPSRQSCPSMWIGDVVGLSPVVIVIRASYSSFVTLCKVKHTNDNVRSLLSRIVQRSPLTGLSQAPSQPVEGRI